MNDAHRNAAAATHNATASEVRMSHDRASFDRTLELTLLIMDQAEDMAQGNVIEPQVFDHCHDQNWQPTYAAPNNPLWGSVDETDSETTVLPNLAAWYSDNSDGSLRELSLR